MSNTKKIHYVQSANSLFNFMKEYQYLSQALKDQRLSPRYCKENIEYLGLKEFKNICVLQKCFCDIPLHKITEKGPVSKKDGSSEEELSHTDFYGEFGIAFSKDWCLEHNFQPVHYVNDNSYDMGKFKAILYEEIQSDEDNDLVDDEVICRLGYLKPLWGTMSRYDEEYGEIDYNKNFHDENEWRFIPDENVVEKHQMQVIIANPYLMEDAMNINSVISEFEDICIKFKYSDIKYLIVPSKYDRINLINDIHKLEINDMEEMILISKIILLDDIKEDW